MRRLRRALGLAMLAAGALVAAGALALGGALWWSLPARHDAATLPGLSAPVRVVMDADGIPRILADTEQDAAAGLGFVHARDRMFQMELGRRAASGRLSELIGPATLRIDRLNRTLGLRRSAEAEFERLDAPTRSLLVAYAAGVNAWIAHRGRWSAPEFVPIGAPEPWTPVDSLLWGKNMALSLAGNWRDELARAALLAQPGATPERLRTLWPVQDRPIPPGAWLQQATRLAAAVPAFPAPFTLPRTASDEWAVDAAHSVTGAPLLAGDPHLGFSFPAIWYLARLQTHAGVLVGATAPGVPFLVLGHNGRVAWTFTTTGADTEDLFVETPVGDDRYATPDGPASFTVREERIKVRGAPDTLMRVRETRHGPVISDLDPVPGGPILAVSMAALAPQGSAAAGLLALNHAQTVADVAEAAPRIVAPVLNLLAAGPDGIGLFMTGRIPVRRAGDGTLPVAGADGAHDWIGYADGELLPRTVNPPSGRLVNGNERVAPPDFPVFLGQDWFGDWRARRIRTLLDQGGLQTTAHFAQMQTDSTSAFAQAVLPRLLRLQPQGAAERAALESLSHWQGDMALDRTEPLLFNEWMRRLAGRLRDREGAQGRLAGDNSDLIARALGPDEAVWCGADCDAMLAATLTEAVTAAGGRTWGAVHPALFRHPLLGQLPWVGPWFGFAIPQPGDGTTLFRGVPPGPGWESLHGPAFRGIYDLADLNRSRFALAPGQSGHVLRHTAGSLLQRWRDGTTLTLGPTLQPAETIELTP